MGTVPTANCRLCLANYRRCLADQHTVPGLVSDCPGSLAATKRLHSDIVYIIFEHNIDDPNPLQTARRTSQVCSQWRNVLLAAPSIWGRIINLSELQLEADVSPWRDVVMQRTGDTPLSISGKVSLHRVGWFLNFLSPYWEKVRHIDVLTTGFGFWDRSVRAPDYMFNSPRSIETFHSPRLTFDPQVPWLVNLRAITFALPFRVSDILEILPTIPLLEHARFNWWYWYNPEMVPMKWYPKVLLPHLACIFIDHFTQEVAHLLRHIVPKKGCIYDIHTLAPFSDHFGGEIVRGVFPRCLRRLIDPSTTNTLRLSVRHDMIDLRTVEHPGTFPRFTHHHEFALSSISFSRQMQHDYISTFLTEYLSYPSSSTFGKPVTSFVFHAAEEPENDGPYLNRCVDRLYQFLSVFPAVSTLGLSQRSLRLLTEMYDDRGSAEADSVLFPSLRNVQLDVYDDKEFDSGLQIVLPLFLNQRRSSGRPIIRLYISALVATTPDVDWSFLDYVQDLEVVWFGETSSDVGPLLDVERGGDTISTYPWLAYHKPQWQCRY